MRCLDGVQSAIEEALLSVAFSRVEAHFVASAIRHTTGPVGIFLFPNYCTSFHYLILFSFELLIHLLFTFASNFLFLPCFISLTFDGSACEHYCFLSCEYNEEKIRTEMRDLWSSYEVVQKASFRHLVQVFPKTLIRLDKRPLSFLKRLGLSIGLGNTSFNEMSGKQNIF